MFVSEHPYITSAKGLGGFRKWQQHAAHIVNWLGKFFTTMITAQKSVLDKSVFDLTFTDFQMSHQKLVIILLNKVLQKLMLNKVLQKLMLSKMSINKSVGINLNVKILK